MRSRQKEDAQLVSIILALIGALVILVRFVLPK